MQKSNAVWFVAGFVVGIGALLIGLAVVPAKAPAAQGEAFDIDDSRVGRKLLRLVDSLDEKLGIRTPETRGAPSASDSKKASLLASDLQTLRCQLELYAVQHNRRYPGLDDRGEFDSQLFVQQLTWRTSVAGKVFSGSDPKDHEYGPYLRTLPANPFVTGPAAERVAGGTGPVPGDGSTGWYFNTATQKFSANDPANKDM